MTLYTEKAPAIRIAANLLPLAVAIALVGSITWFLLTQGWALGAWLLALLLFAHGWVHLVFLFPQPDPAAVAARGHPYPFDMDRSWLIRTVGVDARPVRIVGVGVMAAVFIASVLAALATVALLVPTEWWAGLVVASAVLSMLLLTMFFSPSFLLGYAIDLALLWLVLGLVWSPMSGTPA